MWMKKGGRNRVLAVASGGGHWVQLFRMRPAWNGCEVFYVTTEPGYRADVASDARERGEDSPHYHVVPEANRWQKLRLLWQFWALAVLIARISPHVVISTGASPGYFAVMLGKLLGANTVWVDSIANAGELSLSGRRAGRHVDLWLTQWEHLAVESGSRNGPRFRGAVL